MTSASAPPGRCGPTAERQLEFGGAREPGASDTWLSGSSGCKSESVPGTLGCSSGPRRRTQQVSPRKQ
eukprot:8646561-Alexandrium_andersonii.AAC.1